MQTLNQYPRNVQIRAIGKLISKYGHDGIIRTNAVQDDVEVLFGKYKLSLSGGTLIINNNYKLHVRRKTGGPLSEDPIPSGTRITVNGAEMVALNVRKISPDGANAIVWEIEVSGSSIPGDVNTVEIPVVTAPTNGQGMYASAATDGAGKFSITATASAFDMAYGEGEYVSSDWQIGTDNTFATLVASGSGAVSWTSPVVLDNTSHYFIRVRHVGTTATSQWSAANEFSLGSMEPVPTDAIVRPTIVTAKDGSGYLLPASYESEYDPSTSGMAYRFFLELSAYQSPAGKTFDHTHWQIATDSQFTNIKLETDSTGGYDYTTSKFWESNFLMTFDTVGGHYSMWYARGKYVAADGTESAYSPTFQFLVD